MDWDAFFYNPLDQPNYFIVEVEKKKILIKALKQDGTIIDIFFIDKAKDVSSDTNAQPETVRSDEEKRAA